MSGDLTDYGFVSHVLKIYQPHTIVDLAEQPSAPLAMMDRQHAILTKTNNIIGRLDSSTEYARRWPTVSS